MFRPLFDRSGKIRRRSPVSFVRRLTCRSPSGLCDAAAGTWARDWASPITRTFRSNSACRYPRQPDWIGNNRDMPGAIASGLHPLTGSISAAPPPTNTIRIVSRGEIAGSLRWQQAFAHERKDRRYYELLEDTLKDGFTYGYLSIESAGTVRAIQPYFLVDQDLLAGIPESIKKLIAGIRRLWPRFMRARTMMIGCAAGEGHLDGDEAAQSATAEALAASLPRVAAELNCAMIVLKEFPAKYRASLQRSRAAGFARVPSMPMTTLGIEYKNFDDYLSKNLSPGTRAKTRRKLRAAERAQPPIAMSVIGDVTAVVDEVYPLYEKVYERSPLQFE